MSAIPSEPFPSLAALRAAHAELLRRHRAEGDTADFATTAAQFLQSGRATGGLLAEDEDRWQAQSLLDYWAATLYQAGGTPLTATLDEFNLALAPVIPDEDCPYLGLDAFHEEDAPLFFGRRRNIAELVAILASRRLLVVVGPSGSGKSSLVLAGLAPALKSDAIAGSAGWRYLPTVIPGSDPLVALERALGGAGGGPLLLVIDQFEEIFTLCADEALRATFVERVVGLASDPDVPHRVVLTMRSDFEPFVTRAEALYSLFETGKYAVPPLAAAELRDAIERPAALVGLQFEAGLVDVLLQDLLGEPAALPLLQFTLLRLWEERERNRITLVAYRRVGGGRLALARAADALYARLIPEEQVTARRLLLRMVRISAGLEVTSSRVRRADLDRGGEDPGRIERVLLRLKAARLIRVTPGDTPVDNQVEVAHEALVRNWPTLVQWLDDARLDLRQRGRLTSAADQWEQAGRDASLLLRGLALEEARRYEDVTPSEAAFLAASGAAEAAARKREYQYRRLITTLIWTVSVLAVAAVIFAVVAFNQARATAQQSRIANSQRLAFAAQNQAANNPVRALLLAQEGFSLDDNPVTYDTLRQTLDRLGPMPLVLKVADVSVASASFSPDGRLLATGDVNGGLSFWARDAGFVQAAPASGGHGGAINQVAFSPDGRLLATASADGTVILWDPTTLAPRATFTPGSRGRATGDQGVVSVRFSPDGGRLLAVTSGSQGGAAIVWEVVSRHELAALGSDVAVAAFSPDGERVALGLTDGTASINELAGGAEVRLSGHAGPIQAIAFSPSGDLVATASSDTLARIWNARSGAPAATLSSHTGTVTGLVFSNDSRRLFTTSDDGTAIIWEALTGERLAVLKGHTSGISGLALSADGRMLLTYDASGLALLWDAATGERLGALASGLSPINTAGFALADTVAVTTNADGTAALWDISAMGSGRPRAPRRETSSAWSAAIASPQGNLIAALPTSNERAAILVDRATLKILRTLEGHSDAITSLAFSVDGQRLATGSADRTARLWDTTSGELIALVEAGQTPIQVLFSQDGSLLATVDVEGRLSVWESATGARRTELAIPAEAITSAAFSPDGGSLALTSVAAVYTFTIESGKLTRLLAEQRQTVVFSPSGEQVAIGPAATPDQSIVILAWPGGRELVRLNGNESTLAAMAFSPDGSQLITVGRDNSAILWDASSGEKLTTFTGGATTLLGARYLPDGSRLVLIAASGTPREIVVADAELLREADCLAWRELSPDERAQYGVPLAITPTSAVSCEDFAAYLPFMPPSPATPAPIATPTQIEAYAPPTVFPGRTSTSGPSLTMTPEAALTATSFAAEQATQVRTMQATLEAVRATAQGEALTATAAVQRTALVVRPTSLPPTALPIRQLRVVRLNSNEQLGCLSMNVRGVSTAGWMLRIDGTNLGGSFDGGGNVRVCGLPGEVTFTIVNGTGAVVRGGMGIPAQGGDIFSGIWR